MSLPIASVLVEGLADFTGDASVFMAGDGLAVDVICSEKLVIIGTDILGDIDGSAVISIASNDEGMGDTVSNGCSDIDIEGVEETLGVMVEIEVVDTEAIGNWVGFALIDMNEDVDSLGIALAIEVIDSEIAGDDDTSGSIEVIDGDALGVSVGVAVMGSIEDSDWTGAIVIEGMELINVDGDWETLGFGNMTGADCDALGIIVMVGMDVIDIAEEGEALLLGKAVGVISIGEVVAEADSVGKGVGNEDCDEDGDAVGVDNAPGTTPLKLAGVNGFGIMLSLNSAGF